MTALRNMAAFGACIVIAGCVASTPAGDSAADAAAVAAQRRMGKGV